MSTSTMSISLILQAAEYLDRREREAEHGYACSLPAPPETNRRRTNSYPGGKTKSKLQGNRSTHNELEKNRRAHLRHCLEHLKSAVPLGPDATRHTTLGLLTRARNYIKQLEDVDRKRQQTLQNLHREQRHLRRRLECLNPYSYRVRPSRSYSECSNNSSASSYIASSESDEVDVIGYGSSGQSDDSDDHSSLQSGSDSGCNVSADSLPMSECSI